MSVLPYECTISTLIGRISIHQTAHVRRRLIPLAINTIFTRLYLAEEMPENTPILEFDKPQFQVKLHHDVLALHVKETAIGDFEKLAEEEPSLRDTLRWLLHSIVPLHIQLADIEKVEADTSGRITIKTQMRKDVHIPLTPQESKILLDKLNELIPKAREQSLERKKMAEEAREETEFGKNEGFPYIRKPA